MSAHKLTSVVLVCGPLRIQRPGALGNRGNREGPSRTGPRPPAWLPTICPSRGRPRRSAWTGLTGAPLDRQADHVHILEMNGGGFRLKPTRKRLSLCERRSPRCRTSHGVERRSSRLHQKPLSQQAIFYQPFRRRVCLVPEKQMCFSGKFLDNPRYLGNHPKCRFILVCPGPSSKRWLKAPVQIGILNGCARRCFGSYVGNKREFLAVA